MWGVMSTVMTHQYSRQGQLTSHKQKESLYKILCSLHFNVINCFVFFRKEVVINLASVLLKILFHTQSLVIVVWVLQTLMDSLQNN